MIKPSNVETFFKLCELSNKNHPEAMQLEHLIKNPKYLELYKNSKENQETGKELIFNEMVEHGTVHCGKKKALDHYMQQYYSSSK